MDHDNKVKIQKPEVKLFLPENLYPITKSSPQIYDLEDEYAKTRKNKSFFIPLLMTGVPGCGSSDLRCNKIIRL